MRKIIHIDMDAFFASVEQRENKTLRGKPIVVGGQADKRGVVATASYEARKFGIHSAMATSRAIKLCPELIVVKPNFPLYRDISNQVKEIFLSHSEMVEPVSIDEAYIDVTDCLHNKGSATLIAKSILKEITAKTELTASAGVSFNKFLAKYASDINKPAGIYTVLPDDAKQILSQLDIIKFHGIGPATAKKLKSIGIYNGADLKSANLIELREKIGKSADFYYNLANGNDDRLVKSERRRKSVASETTFLVNIADYYELESRLLLLLKEAVKILAHKDLLAKTITVKIKFSDFKIKTKSYTEKLNTLDYESSELIARYLLRQFEFKKSVRLAGISFSNLIKKSEYKEVQKRLFR